MANHVDDKINELINEHAAESEKAGVSRDVDETGRRIKAALEGFTKLDILASDHWGGLYYEAKIMALREAILEMAAPVSLTEAAQDVVEAKEALADAIERAAEELAPPVKKARKAKAVA